MHIQARSNLSRLGALILAALFLQGCNAKYKFVVPDKVSIGEVVVVAAKVEKVLVQEASGWTVSPETLAVVGEDKAEFEKILSADLKARIDKKEAQYSALIKKKEAAERESAIAKKRLADLKDGVEKELVAAQIKWEAATTAAGQEERRQKLAEAKIKADAAVKGISDEVFRAYDFRTHRQRVYGSENEWVHKQMIQKNWTAIYYVVEGDKLYLPNTTARTNFYNIFKPWLDYEKILKEGPSGIRRPERNYPDEFWTLTSEIAKLDSPPSVEKLKADRDYAINEEKTQRFDKDFGFRRIFVFGLADAGKTFDFVWDKKNCSDCKNTDGKIEVTGPRVEDGSGGASMTKGPKLRLIKAEGNYALSQAGINAIATQVVSTSPVLTSTAVSTTVPTNTPVVTNTPVPTLVPTNTPVPTSTPIPGCPDVCNPICPNYDACEISCGPADFCTPPCGSPVSPLCVPTP